MKKLFALILTVTLVFALAGCGGDKPSGDRVSIPSPSGSQSENPGGQGSTPGGHKTDVALGEYTLPENCSITWDMEGIETQLVKIGGDFVTRTGTGNTAGYIYYKQTDGGYEVYTLMGIATSWNSDRSITVQEANSDLIDDFNESTLAVGHMYGMEKKGTETLTIGSESVTAERWSDGSSTYYYHPDYSIVLKVETWAFNMGVVEFSTSISSFEDAGVPSFS